MKKKHWIIIGIGIILLVFAAFVLFRSCSENQKFNISGKIASVRIESYTLNYPVGTSDENAIAVLLECLKKVKLNNKYRIKDIEVAPFICDITFFFSDGKIKTYTYTAYPAEKYDNPFKDFFDMFPESP